MTVAVTVSQEIVSCPPRSLEASESASGDLTGFSCTERLTAALRRGDEAAFRELHRRWNGRLFRYCYAIANGEGALAGDIAQAAYLRAFRHMRVLPNEEALWNWLARAARCASVDLQRGRSRYRNALTRFAESLRDWCGRPAATLDVSDADPEAFVLQALEEALREIDESDRRLVEARYYQRLPLGEIAQQQACSSRAIEGRLSRIRSKLRRRVSTALRQKGSKSQ